MKGVSYGPVPIKQLGDDDFFSSNAAFVWGSRGRDDLGLMKMLGISMVRLYGNNPEKDHMSFLDRAHSLGIGVVPGFSEYPYKGDTYPDPPGNCMKTGYNCFTQIKAQYKSMLTNGFTVETGDDKVYHPGLRSVILINEPDYKLPGLTEPLKFTKALVSAFDAVLDAEKEFGVKNPQLKFTVTFAFGICDQCRSYKEIEKKYGTKNLPGICQMLDLRSAMYDPSVVGYTARNDLKAAYDARWENSFNTANEAPDIEPFILDYYDELFPDTPVFIGEYHKPGIQQAKDFKAILDIARNDTDKNGRKNKLLGISFFEWDVRTDKGGAEMEFGMWATGNYTIDTINFGDEGGAHDVKCLVPAMDKVSGETMPEVIRAAYGGAGVPDGDYSMLCQPNPSSVKINAEGFQLIQAQNSTKRMAEFIARVVMHMGGVVKDDAALTGFAAKYSTPNSTRLLRSSGTSLASTFAALASTLASNKPSFARWDANAKCTADRQASDITLGSAIGFACGKLGGIFDCAQVPDECSQSIFQKADYIFSIYYSSMASASPLTSCDFGGAGIFASSEIYESNSRSGCVICEMDPIRKCVVPGPAGGPGPWLWVLVLLIVVLVISIIVAYYLYRERKRGSLETRIVGESSLSEVPSWRETPGRPLASASWPLAREPGAQPATASWPLPREEGSQLEGGPLQSTVGDLVPRGAADGSWRHDDGTWESCRSELSQQLARAAAAENGGQQPQEPPQTTEPQSS